MKKTMFMDKYPIYTLRLEKTEIDQNSVDEIVEYFKEKIELNKIAKFIAVFDHYAHTKNLGGEIEDGMIDAKNIIFCFGAAIPNSKILAARPRSIGICEYDKYFIIEFVEAPKEEMHTLMENWSKELVRKLP